MKGKAAKLDLCCAVDDEGLAWKIIVTLTAAKYRHRHILRPGNS